MQHVSSRSRRGPYRCLFASAHACACPDQPLALAPSVPAPRTQTQHAMLMRLKRRGMKHRRALGLHFLAALGPGTALGPPNLICARRSLTSAICIGPGAPAGFVPAALSFARRVSLPPGFRRFLSSHPLPKPPGRDMCLHFHRPLNAAPVAISHVPVTGYPSRRRLCSGVDMAPRATNLISHLL